MKEPNKKNPFALLVAALGIIALATLVLLYFGPVASS
jgi:hypothetical protein